MNQKVNLDKTGRFRIGDVIHEVFHSLGRYHEQSRNDRDDHIAINFDNIEERYRSQFQVRSPTDLTFNVPYDLNSIMHYPGIAFSSNGRVVINANDRNFQSNMGQSGDATLKDYQQLNRAYCESEVIRHMHSFFVIIEN